MNCTLAAGGTFGGTRDHFDILFGEGYTIVIVTFIGGDGHTSLIVTFIGADGHTSLI